MRALIGLFALVLLLFGIAARGSVDEAMTGAALRCGLMMTVWWFAFPQVQNVPRWLAVSGGIALVLVMLRPKLILVAIPVLIVLWILRPRVPRKQSAGRD